MGLISPGGQNILEFLELWQVLLIYHGAPRDPLWWPQERPAPCEFLEGLSGFLYRRWQGLRPCVESGPEHEDSSPVLTWIFGYLWSLPRGVSPPLECGHALALSSRAVAAVSPFCHVDQRIYGFLSSLSHEAFPRGFPKGCPTCTRVGSRSSA